MSQQIREPCSINLLMSGWKEGEENWSKIQQKWMLRDQLKSQGTTYLPEEDLQDVQKEDGAA